MSKMILMKDYYNLRFGYCDGDSESDFIDNINGKLNICMAKGCDGESGKQHFFLFHNGKFISKSESSLFQNIDIIVNSFSNLDPRFNEIAKVLVCSLYVREDYSSYEEVSDINTKFSEGYFEASETAEVSDFSPCFFGVGSVTHDCNSKINLSSGEIIHQGEKIDNMSDFYGWVDEDDTWVIGSNFNRI